MTPSEYVTAALRTKSDTFHSEAVPKWKADKFLFAALSTGDLVDELKKGLFYGRETPHLDAIVDTGYYSARVDWKDSDVVHGILGIFTEAKELLDEMMYIELDRKAVLGEVGDLLWYVALLLSSLDATFEEVMDGNIEKLKNRFPEKFSEQAALERVDVTK